MTRLRPTPHLVGLVGLVGLALISGCPGTAAVTVDEPPEGDTTLAVVDAATFLLESLDAGQQAAIAFEFTDDAQRKNWSNLPTGIFSRSGVKLGDMTEVQQDAVFAVLAAILSPEGFAQVTNTVNADEALKQSDGGGNLTFGRDEYFTSILGTPSTTTSWMFQFGGHHLAINATIVGKDITLNPSLTGAQPASYELDGVTVRPQGPELDQAFAFIDALSAEHRAAAVVGTSFQDLVLGPGQDGKTLSAEGVRASDLDADEQAALWALIATRVNLLNAEDAAPLMATIEADVDDITVSWNGPTAAGSAATWRVAGPHVNIEYAPQSLGGDATDHTHAMWRDPTNDYGAAFLAR